MRIRVFCTHIYSFLLSPLFFHSQFLTPLFNRSILPAPRPNVNYYRIVASDRLEIRWKTKLLSLLNARRRSALIESLIVYTTGQYSLLIIIYRARRCWRHLFFMSFIRCIYRWICRSYPPSPENARIDRSRSRRNKYFPLTFLSLIIRLRKMEEEDVEEERGRKDDRDDKDYQGRGLRNLAKQINALFITLVHYL